MALTITTLALLQAEVEQMDDAADLARVLAAVGSFALERLGFTPGAPADVKIDIGDEDPDRMSIKIIWPVPDSSDPDTEAPTEEN
jgi:hypothetical protein